MQFLDFGRFVKWLVCSMFSALFYNWSVCRPFVFNTFSASFSFSSSGQLVAPRFGQIVMLLSCFASASITGRSLARGDRFTDYKYSLNNGFCQVKNAGSRSADRGALCTGRLAVPIFG